MSIILSIVAGLWLYNWLFAPQVYIITDEQPVTVLDPNKPNRL